MTQIQFHIQNTTNEIKDYKAKEDFVNGTFYSKEIFDLQKEKHILQSQYEHRKARINRLNAGF